MRPPLGKFSREPDINGDRSDSASGRGGELIGGAAEIRLPALASDRETLTALAHLHRPCGCLRFELTDREVDVLEQLAEGKSTGGAARCLYVSPQAVTYHVGNLLAKLGSSNRTELVSRAFVLGVLSRTWPPRVVRPPHGHDVEGLAMFDRSRVKDSHRGRTFV